jgi:hypothetical protein
METSTFEPEKNRAPSPLLIVKKRTKKISNREYYGTLPLKVFDLKETIQKQVEKEDLIEWCLAK